MTSSLTPQPLTPDQAARLQNAFTLLQSNKPREAIAAARAVCSQAPLSPDALHLLAICLGAVADPSAESAFRRAQQLAPKNAQILTNFANFLTRAGRTPEALTLYRQAVSSSPAFLDAWLNYGLAANKAGETLTAIAALEQAIKLRPDSATAWQGLGNARRNNDDYVGAEAAFRRSVEIDPRNGLGWLNLGVILRLLGDPSGSLECYQQARRTGFSGPELEDSEASARCDLGDHEAALAQVRALVKSAPGYTPGHELMAHILWEYGDLLAPGEDAAESFAQAAAQRPDDDSLNIALANFLIEANRPDDALAIVRRLRAAADQPILVATEANALEIAGRHEQAARLFETAYKALHNNPPFLNVYARHMLKTAKPDGAARLAEEAVAIAPNNQESWAFLATAWRLLEDSREFWLCDYDRIIDIVDVEPPADFNDVAGFIADLERTLEPMHKAQRAPVNQSLRDGSQTSGSLFGRRDPTIAAARAALLRAVERHIAALPEDPTHPFLKRKAGSVQFTGSWSVRLWKSGRHVNHYHPRGWMSSAFYVTLPPSVRAASGADDDRSGWIQFGEPPVDLGLNLPPRRVIRPSVGRLALFPSYMWHGTVPFDDPSPRMTMAFDMAPAALSR